MRTLLILLIAAISFNITIAAEYHVDKDKKNEVKFISDAPIEDFEGVTEKIDGYLFNSDGELKGSEVYFEVDLNSVDTGIGLRNTHMRDNYLHTDKYPITHFTGKIYNVKKSGNKYKVKAKGVMFIHGVKRDKDIEAELVEDKSGNFRIKSQFVIPISKYDIEVPSLMFQKIDENMDLRLDFHVKKVS